MLKTSYSFDGADLIASALLRNVGGGNYIDVGANHPQFNNNTNFFYRKGWRGLAIEGNDQFKELWEKDRPQDIFVSALISNVVKNVEFAIFPDNSMSTIDVSTIKRISSRFKSEEIIKQEKSTTTLFDVKNKFFNNTEIHLLCIDIENEDFNCLLGAQLELWKPGLIVIEVKNLSLYNILNNEIVEYLTSIGYRMIAKTALDAFFVFPKKKYLDWIPETIL